MAGKGVLATGVLGASRPMHGSGVAPAAARGLGRWMMSHSSDSVIRGGAWWGFCTNFVARGTKKVQKCAEFFVPRYKVVPVVILVVASDTSGY